MECIHAAAFGVQGAAGARGPARGAPGAVCSARCEGLGLTYYFWVGYTLVLLIWIDELDAGVITGVEPRL
jgi:hypothetical protein